MGAGFQPSLFQASLFQPALPGVDGGFEGIHRTELAHGAWVDYLPGWLPDADSVFDTLVREVPWQAERRAMYDSVVDVPRLLRFYVEGVALPSPVLETARDSLSGYYSPTRFTTAGLCCYRDGRDSVAWHGDMIGRGAYADTLVAIVSLGAARALMLRPRGGGRSLRFLLGHGDLLVMGGSCQRTWEHAVPKARGVGTRVSVQFRPPGVR
ncbi:alpha-ketoglutarate-dependent dioxygenase AlkB [Actinokineospora enzanensis]|uniref:alpha-ketoglutarate-dependent dioxygenase AlkB n=1 Tax=Actinokineospora enzanensis TaxID=155975 RepID=UPI000477039B|nr:alpha-ketoglutarate-dependent dioxygenase AlkB [Actinokineospora enzanensis]